MIAEMFIHTEKRLWFIWLKFRRFWKRAKKDCAIWHSPRTIKHTW